MGNNNSWKGEISIAPCPAGEFSGRHKERLRLIEVLQVTKERSQVILATGRRGSGKSSFLNWAENEIQSKTGGEGCPAIKKGFSETPGMVIETYRDLLVGMKEYKKFGWFSKTLDNSKVKKYFDISMSALEKLSPLAGPYGAGVNAAAIAAKGIVSSPTADYAQLRSSFLSVLSGISEELAKNDKIMAFLQIEDLLGSVEVIVFPRDYEKYNSRLVEDGKVFIKGRVSLEEDRDGKLICERITSFDEIPKKLWIRFPTMEAYEAGIEDLLRDISESEGNDSVVLYIEDKKQMKKLPPGRNVNADEALYDALCKKYGKDNIKIAWDVKKD